jgi:hypothetical protein
MRSGINWPGKVTLSGLAGLMLAATLVVPASAAAVVKAGAPCVKVGQVKPFKGYQYTCVLKNRKPVWSKGKSLASIAAAKKAAERKAAQTAAVAKAEREAAEKAAAARALEGPCSNPFEKISATGGYVKCSHAGAAQFYWRFFPEVPTPTRNASKYQNRATAGQACDLSGDTVDVAQGYLECRWVNPGTLQWVVVVSDMSDYVNITSPRGVEPCKLRSADAPVKSGRDSGPKNGFPVPVLYDQIRNPGDNEVLVLGMDFPELLGDDKLLDKMAYDIKWMADWYSYFSNGQVRMNVTTIDHWVRSPRAASEYGPADWDFTSSDANNASGRKVQAFIDVITEHIDLRNFSTVYIFFPEGEYTQKVDFIVRNHRFKIKEGFKNLHVYPWNADIEAMATLRWAYYIHESLHDFAIIGHGPGNGWPLGIMQNQSGISLAMNPWEQFLLGWLPDDQIFCIAGDSLETVKVSLSPVEREDKRTKMAVVALSTTKAIVVEAHSIDKWSDFKMDDRAFPSGMYGVWAYVVDLFGSGAPPVGPDGRVVEGDTGNDPNRAAWAIMQRVDGGGSFRSEFNFSSGRQRLNDYVAVLGDSFTIEGIKITLVATGNYETIEITKVRP